MWQWLLVIVSVAAAASIQRWWVPRLRRPHVDDGEAPPSFVGLGSPAHVLLAAALAAAASSLVVVTPAPLWVMVCAYAALGAPLVVVDLRTTYLPNQLMHPLWAAMSLGAVLSALHSPGTAAGAVIGAAAGYGAFWLVWRSSSTFGFGDVRLAAAVGALAGASGAMHWAWAFLSGTALGAVAAIVAAVWGRRILPYGPWLWSGPVLAGWLTTGG